MKSFLKNPNSNFYISLLVICEIMLFIIPNNAVAGKTITHPPLKVIIPNTEDSYNSGKLISFGAGKLDYYPNKSSVSASENVDIEDSKTIILADRMDYNQKTDELTATGNVVILEPDGHVKFSDNAEIDGITKDAVVNKLKIKLANTPSFKENQEAQKNTPIEEENSDDSMFSRLFSGISSSFKEDDKTTILANLEPAAGGDSPIPTPSHEAENETKTDVSSNPIISLPTAILPDQETLKTEKKETLAKTESKKSTSTIVSTSSILNDKDINSTNKSAPTVSVDSSSLTKIEEPKIEPTKTIAPNEVTNSIPENKSEHISNIKQSIPPKQLPTVEDKQKPIAKKNKQKKQNVETKKPYTPIVESLSKNSTTNSEETLSEDSRKLLNSIAPKITSNQSKSTPPPIDIDHQHTIVGLLKSGETTDNNIPNPELGVKVEKKAQKINIDYQLGKAYDSINSGQSDAAIATYKDILDNSPNNTQALFGLATLYHRARQLDKARPLYSKLLAIDPNNRDGFNNFLVLLADEAPREALVEMEKLEAKNPGFSTIPAQIAVIYQKMGNLDKATDKMFRAVSLAPENLTYRYNLAIMMDKQKNYGEAEKLYKQIIEAAARGEKIPGNIENLQQRLTFISSNRP